MRKKPHILRRYGKWHFSIPEGYLIDDIHFINRRACFWFISYFNNKGNEKVNGYYYRLNKEEFIKNQL